VRGCLEIEKLSQEPTAYLPCPVPSIVPRNGRAAAPDERRFRRTLRMRGRPETSEGIVPRNARCPRRYELPAIPDRPYGWRRPGMEDTREPGVYRLPADAAALRVMVENQLGRPSTWPDHVKNFVGRELVDADMKLTAKGRFWLQSTPAALLDPKTSRRIEDVLNRAGGQGRSGGRSDGLPDPAPAAAVDREDDRPLVDPTPWVTLTHRAIVKLPKSLRARIAEVCLEPVSQQIARAEAVRAAADEAEAENRAAADGRSTLSRGLREAGGDQARFAEVEK
jgi:hypothetical protein